MIISVNAKARIIASLTVGGFIALFFIAVGCQGNYGVIEEERVPMESVSTSSKTIEAVPFKARPEPDVVEMPTIVVRPDTIRNVSYNEAEAAFKARDYEKAVELFTHYTRRKKTNAWGFFMLGLSAHRASDLVEARGAFETATNLDPRHIKSWTNLSRVYLDSKQPAKAVAALDEALAIEAGAKDAYRLKARAHHQQGNLEEAKAAYKQALVQNDQDSWSMNNLALVLIQQKQYDEALPVLARAVEVNGNVALFYNNLGMVLENKGHFRAAQDAYASAVKLDASYEKAVVNHDRVEKVAEMRGLEAPDLSARAAEFIADLQTWKRTQAGG